MSNRKRKKIDTKQRIAEAAYELFSKNSYDLVTTEEVANYAQVAKGTVFHHFETKIDLALGALEYFAINELDFMKELFAKPKKITLETFIDFNLNIVFERPGITQLLLVLTSLQKNSNENMSEKFNSFINTYLKPMYKEIAVIFPNNNLSDMQLIAYGRILIGTLDGLGIQLILEKLGPNDPIIKELKATLVELFQYLTGVE